jgi:hypothetical protein
VIAVAFASEGAVSQHAARRALAGALLDQRQQGRAEAASTFLGINVALGGDRAIGPLEQPGRSHGRAARLDQPNVVVEVEVVPLVPGLSALNPSSASAAVISAATASASASVGRRIE